MLKIVVILDEARSSYATHNRKLKELSLLRSKSPSPSHFFSAFSKTLTLLFHFHRRLASTDRVVSFVSTFAAAANDEFLDHFLKFLLAAAVASNKTARYRTCQMVVIVDDSRPIYRRVAGCFMNKFFPSGYPSVSEGYLRYTQFRAVQHVTKCKALSCYQLGSSSDNLKILVKDVTRNSCDYSLLFSAGLRPTPAQATAVSWILKDGMQHVGKLICSNWGARMDSEPKRWRLLGLQFGWCFFTTFSPYDNTYLLSSQSV
ncbi:hypothetical protein Fmac_016022 [Flemingia macrophylla]|uniref:Protein root UVB sensitive/RUS domain-containing protein n=1 Tax=Flemingia macrophylla TaxID=520843 RepID=A0ABD1MG77_9FABA